MGGNRRDVRALKGIIDNDVAQAPAVIMDLAVDEAVTAWKNVAQAADQFRHSVYVIVHGASQGPTGSTSGK